MSVSFAEFLKNSKSTSLSFENLGDTHTGTVDKVEVKQVTDMDTNEPAFWSNGDPKMQVLVTLQCGIDPTIQGDNGLRTLFVKGWGDQWKAFTAALAAAGMEDVQVGAKVTATLSGFGTPPKKGYNAPKIITYQIEPGPGPVAQVQGQPAVQQQAPVQQPAQQQFVQQQPVQQQAPAPVQQQAQVQPAPIQQAPVPQQQAQPTAQQASLPGTFDSTVCDAMIHAGANNETIRAAQPAVTDEWLQQRRADLGLPPF